MAGTGRPPLRTLVAVAAWGAVSALIAWTIARGSVLVFLAVMVGIGIAMRLVARHLVLRRGQQPPRWWWL
jgi:CHASE2 domain-containing sensor protein